MGSSWNYTHNDAGWLHNRHLKTIKDTLVHGKTVHKILDKYTYYTTHHYVYQKNDTVYQYYPSADTFLSLYIFNVNTGDTITLEAGVCFGTTYRMVIDTAFTIVIDGISLRKFSSRGIDGCSYAPNAFMDTVIEGIGSLSRMFPQGGFAISSNTYPLRCYSDSIIDTNFTNLPCDYQYVYSINENSLNSKITLSPNPAQNTLNIESGELEIIYYEIFDIQGKVISFEANSNSQIDVSHFKQGVYLLKIHTKSGIIIKKWVKE